MADFDIYYGLWKHDFDIIITLFSFRDYFYFEDGLALTAKMSAGLRKMARLESKLAVISTKQLFARFDAQMAFLAQFDHVMLRVKSAFEKTDGMAVNGVVDNIFWKKRLLPLPDGIGVKIECGVPELNVLVSKVDAAMAIISNNIEAWLRKFTTIEDAAAVTSEVTPAECKQITKQLYDQLAIGSEAVPTMRRKRWLVKETEQLHDSVYEQLQDFFYIEI